MRNDEECAARLGAAYRKVCHFIGLFDAHGFASRYDDLDRRLEILRLIRDL